MQTSTSKNQNRITKKVANKTGESEIVRRAREALARAIEHDKRNKAFAKLSPDKQRVAIAEDALLQIKLKRLTPTNGTYVQIATEGYSAVFDANTPACEAFSGECDVCAKGALFVAAIDLKNGVKLKNLMKDEVFGDKKIDVSCLDSSHIVSYLRGIFSKKQLDLMEAAFERDHLQNFISPKEAKALGYNSETGAALVFMPEEHDAEDRLVTILKNIVRNKGEFVLEKKEVSVETW